MIQVGDFYLYDRNEFTFEDKLICNMIGKELLDFIKRGGLCVAGGTLRSIFGREKVSDIDLYLGNSTEFSKTYLGFDASSVPHKLLLDSSNAATFEVYPGTNRVMIVQFIKVISGLVIDILSEFDFTICMAAWSPFSGFTFHKDFLRHLASKSLVINTQCKYPLATIARLPKYLSRGFKISGIDLVKLGILCTKVNLKDMSEAKKHLMGIDIAYLTALFSQMEKDGCIWSSPMELIGVIERYINNGVEVEREEVNG